MSVILKAKTFSVPEQYALAMRGVQTDAYGEVLGGHKAIIDPMQVGMTGTLAAGATIKNLVATKPDASVYSAFTSQTVESAKGIPFTSLAGGAANETVQLPDDFNLLNLGTEPSAVISLWATHRDLTATLNAIAGCAYQVSANAQWYMSTGNASGKFRFGFQGASAQVGAALNTPTLYTIYFKRTAAGVMQIQCAVNGNVVSTASSTYPFKDPTAAGVGGPPPRSKAYLGALDGFVSGWNGIIHRVQLLKVDPESFDLADWLAAEVSNNSGRFTV